MLEHLPAEAVDAAFKPSDEAGKLFADLGSLARAALEAAGIAAEDIADSGLSTYADAARFWSFRRDGERSGRHAALIWIDPAH